MWIYSVRIPQVTFENLTGILPNFVKKTETSLAMADFFYFNDRDLGGYPR